LKKGLPRALKKIIKRTRLAAREKRV